MDGNANEIKVSETTRKKIEVKYDAVEHHLNPKLNLFATNYLLIGFVDKKSDIYKTALHI